AWLPSYDPDFQKYCRLFAGQYGWPKGPINAFSLWNEPWEGISISGWGADMTRYREIFTHMAQGVDEARKTDGVDVLLGGCDSSTNAMDKLFPDGKDTFLKWFDFLSIHYQGLDPNSTVKAWVDRKGPHGRVKIWDTESWVANTDDRVAAVVAADRAAGYDRAMGIFGGNIAENFDYDMRLPDGKTKHVNGVNAWSVAAAVGASQHFIGERPFKELLFKNGLPWVMLFDGLPDGEGRVAADDGTIVVVGDIGEEFGKDQLLFRTATGLKNRPRQQELERQIAALPADAPEADRTSLQTALTREETLEGASMTLDAQGGLFSLYDFYGNPVPAENGKIIVPLDGRGFFLRSNGSKGSFARLVDTVRNSHVDGIEPLAPVAHDMTAPIDEHPTLRLSLTNILNRPVSGALNVKVAGLGVSYPQNLSFKANETKEVPVKVTSGVAVSNNTYPLSLMFNGGRDGTSSLQEDMHVNVITHRTIRVDGKLDDWNGVPPQPVVAPKTVAPTLTEAAWFPFKTFDASVKGGYANGYLAYDKDNFYFAARIADDTPDEGMVRFETRNDDEYYYPAVSYLLKPESVLQKRPVVWAKSSTEARALQLPGEGTDRTAAAWEDTVKSFAVDLKLPNDGAHQVAFYFLDWDDDSRRNLKVTITDAATGKTLDQRDINQFRLGKYLVYNLAGNLRVTFSTNSWISATVSGIFFDSLRQANPVNEQGPYAHFVTLDDHTGGNWKGVYGADGYNIITAAEKYPAYVTVTTPEVTERETLTWPADVRRYSYRKDPELPAGNAPNHDNVQIAFNVLPPDRKPWYPAPPGTMPGFIHYKDTDYEYALNPVAVKYGGGVEIWRLDEPGMPHKNFYPRQPRSPYDGPVKNGQLAITRDGNTRIVEAAIPWSEIPDVKKCLDAHRTIKFSYRVNDNANIGCMELSRLRSVAKRNGSFHVDWTEHWANELEFGWGK
ncbi:MAG: hypothetical protein M3Y56_06480, partial [Armatimonadota bacterium]|nr:hypothetical protein [Armatimonadota bacterium]